MSVVREHASLRELKALFASLAPPSPETRHGFFRASFIGPAWLRLAARPSLEVSGLRGWQGKRFLTVDDATNVLSGRGGDVDALRMRVTPGRSRIDGRDGVELAYLPENGRRAPIPWRWVRDELRAVDADTVLGMTVVDLPLLRRFAFPFLLRRER